MNNEKIINEILKSREERAFFQQKIIALYNNPIISFTLNIPGHIKDSDKFRKIHDVGMDIITSELKDNNCHIRFVKRINKSTGSEGYFSVDMDVMELKRITTKIENQFVLGRIFDIDVFDSEFNQISRLDLGLNPRKCLICEKNAKLCSRERTHELSDLLDEIEKLYNQYFVKGI